MPDPHATGSRASREKLVIEDLRNRLEELREQADALREQARAVAAETMEVEQLIERLERRQP